MREAIASHSPRKRRTPASAEAKHGCRSMLPWNRGSWGNYVSEVGHVHYTNAMTQPLQKLVVLS